MRSGSIKFFLSEKGFGFIQPDDKSPDIFLHSSVLRNCGIEPDSIAKGDKLLFESGPGKKGEQAVKIERA